MFTKYDEFEGDAVTCDLVITPRICINLMRTLRRTSWTAAIAAGDCT